jgi:hypothetical protein
MTLDDTSLTAVMDHAQLQGAIIHISQVTKFAASMAACAIKLKFVYVWQSTNISQLASLQTASPTTIIARLEDIISATYSPEQLAAVEAKWVSPIVSISTIALTRVLISVLCCLHV